MTRRALVTGASGFLGQRLVTALKDRNFQIIGADRHRPHEGPQVDAHVVREITANTDWAGIFEDVDCVVHLADGLRHFEGQHGRLDQRAAAAQVEASARLAECAFGSGVETFLYVSSIKAMAGESATHILTEGHKPAPTALYGRLKLDVERRLQALAASTSTRLIIIRPPIVYGSGVGGNFARLLRLADTAWPLPLGGLQNARSMIYVETLADAIAAALERGGNGTFLLHDGPTLSTSEVIRHLREGLGRPPRTFAIPVPIWNGLGAIPHLRPFVRRLSGSLAVSDALFREQFGWRPRLSVEQALKLTARAYKGRTRRQRRPETSGTRGPIA